ncbi:MAG: hypothetical protein HWD85_05760 [Flavobacteriaceae bacterium]|nr:hypothetical protein [Flavobacteriaceae bacterium]
MKKQFLTLLLITIVSTAFAQKEVKISTVDFIQILNNNKKEVLFYYQNNWEELRKKAVKKSYIDSYQLLETTPTKDAPFSFMLITTYKNKAQFDKREAHFQELIKAQGKLKLLNNKKPKEFRKTIFGKDVYHRE